MRPLTLSRLLLQCAILGAILFCVMVIALKFGAVHVSLYGLGRDLLRVLMGKNTEISSNYSLILNLRLPRIFLSVIVGASLSVAGTSFQALLRNPLADPYVLGVSSGAAVGAILALLLEPHLALSPEIASVFTPLGGFLGASVAITAAPFQDFSVGCRSAFRLCRGFAVRRLKCVCQQEAWDLYVPALSGSGID